MGLRNSAQSFQRMMTSVLDGLSNCYCYLDDILVFTKTEQEHFKILHDLFTRLQRAGLAVSLDKCAFGQPSMDFLGYDVGPNGIKPLPKKVEAIVSYPAPTKPKQLLGFLGALNYYRRTLPKVN